MSAFRTAILLVACVAAPAMAQQRRQPQQTANAQFASLQKQVQALTEERDALQQKVDEIPFLLRQENAELYRQLDEAIAQKDEAIAKLDQLEATLKENQAGGDSILRELRQAKDDLRDSNNKIEELENELASAHNRLYDLANVKEGTLVHFSSDIVPAKCLNLRRMTPSVRKASGIVVVNCLVNELGDPLEVCLIQGLSGEGAEWVEKAHEACLEAAKRLVFEPATTKEGIRLKVWQGIAFHLK